MTEPLAGLSVLVTRPREHAQALSERLRALGAAVTQLPAIEIEPVPLDDALRSALQEAADADWLIFVSRPAVRHGLAGMRTLGLAVPPRAGLAVVGPGTAAALVEAGLSVRLQPDSGFTSEALLALPDLRRVSGSRVVIFRGVGGRELLAETLSGRGARVRFAELYRRCRPGAPAAPALADWQRQPRRLVIVTSQGGLTNLMDMASAAERAALKAADLLTVSERVADAARAQGFKGRVAVAPCPDDDGFIEAALSVNKLDQDKDTDG